VAEKIAGTPQPVAISVLIGCGPSVDQPTITRYPTAEEAEDGVCRNISEAPHHPERSGCLRIWDAWGLGSSAAGSGEIPSFADPARVGGASPQDVAITGPGRRLARDAAIGVPA
jgi:hypothetical protein